MLFEDFYDSVLRRYRGSPAKVEQERQAVRGRLYEWLDATQPGREAQTKRVEETKENGENPSE